MSPGIEQNSEKWVRRKDGSTIVEQHNHTHHHHPSSGTGKLLCTLGLLGVLGALIDSTRDEPFFDYNAIIARFQSTTAEANTTLGMRDSEFTKPQAVVEDQFRDILWEHTDDPEIVAIALTLAQERSKFDPYKEYVDSDCSGILGLSKFARSMGEYHAQGRLAEQYDLLDSESRVMHEAAGFISYVKAQVGDRQTLTTREVFEQVLSRFMDGKPYYPGRNVDHNTTASFNCTCGYLREMGYEPRDYVVR